MTRTSVALKAAVLAFTAGVWVASPASGQAQPAPVAATDAPAPVASGSHSGSHYIEFRVATIGTYGHSYVAYGRLNEKGQPVETKYADLHPTGNYAVMAIGHVLPVPANTTWDPDVLKLPVSSSFRRRLNAAEHRKLLAAIQRFRANKQPYWNAVTYNCNNFVADLAQAIGMITPSTLLASYAFIPALRDMNDAGRPAESTSRRSAGMAHKPAARAQSPGS